MRTYRVTLQRSVAYEASIEVPAIDEFEARRIAEQRAKDDLVAWTETFSDVTADAEEHAG